MLRILVALVIVVLIAVALLSCTTMQPVAKPENSQNCQILGQDNIWRTCESLGRVF